MSARLSDYDYDLPRELIAQRPLEHREDSRMMVLDRARQTIQNRQFRKLKTFLQRGDLLVLNDTRVLPARRFSDDGTVEFLFLERLGPKSWKCLVKPGRKMRIGATARIDKVALRVDEITANGERIVASDEELDPFSGGSMPLPPYIKRPSDDEDLARYQTVFAHATGAVAAPDRKSTRLNSSHTVIYNLSLHDALPISRQQGSTRSHCALMRLRPTANASLHRMKSSILFPGVPCRCRPTSRGRATTKTWPDIRLFLRTQPARLPRQIGRAHV